MKMDSDIEKNVKEELRWSPGLSTNDIAVSVKSGVVSLTGFTHSYADKYDAERAAKRVAGVVGVANDIEVRLREERADPEITRDAVAAIKSRLPFSYERIKVVTRTGWITLEGKVEWQYQKQTAENAVRHINGVKGVSNLIDLNPQVQPIEVNARSRKP